MNIVTVIPARGGSKGIPKKNIIDLNGIPLIGYTIQYSLNCPLVNKTIVSTDSQEIARISEELGAEVPFIRPKEIAKDLTPDFPVMLHALNEIEKSTNQIVDFIVLLRPTSPFRPKGLIEQGIKLISEINEADSVRAVMESNQHPYRQWKSNSRFITGYETSVHEPYNLPRQVLPKVFFQTGDIEIIRRSTLLKGSVSGKKILPLEINPEDVLDIDTLKDLYDAKNR